MPIFQRSWKDGNIAEAGELGAFVRATDKTAVDFEGLVRTYNSGLRAYVGWRRVVNLNTEDDLTNWVETNGATTTTNTYTVVNNNSYIGDNIASQNTKGVFVLSFDIYGDSTPMVAELVDYGDGSDSSFFAFTVTSTRVRYSVTMDNSASSTFSGNVGVFFNRGAVNGTPGAVVTIENLIVEEVTGQANQNPSTYITAASSRHYPYENGNTVASNIVSLSQGAALTTMEGMLLEDAATNIQPESEDFTTGYSLIKATLTSGSTGPDGAASAYKLNDDSSTGTGNVYLQETVITVTTAVDMTWSIYAKADQLGWIAMQTTSFDAGANKLCYFNVNSGAGAVGTSTFTDEGIEDIGNGWYRCWVVFNTTTDLVGSMTVYVCDDDGDSTVDLDGTSSVLLFGQQVESSSFPTSYIATSGSTATRNADSWLADTTDDLGIGDPVNDMAGWMVIRPQHDNTDTKTFQSFAHMIGASDTRQGLRFSYHSTTALINLSITDELGVSTVLSGSGNAYTRNDQVLVCWVKDSAGARLWIDDGAVITATDARSKADFDVGLNEFRLGAERSSITWPSHTVFEHMTLWTGGHVPTDAYLAALTTSWAILSGPETEFFVDPSIAGDSGTGTLADPYGDVEYAFAQARHPASGGARMNIKAGTDEVLVANISLTAYETTNSIGSANNFVMQGYTAVAGDGGIGGISGGGLVSIFNISAQDYVHFADLHMHNTGANRIVIVDNFCTITNCEFDDCSTTAVDVDVGVVRNCYFHDISGTYCLVAASTEVVGCRFIDTDKNINNCLFLGTTSRVHDSEFWLDNVSGAGMLRQVSTAVIHCSFYNNTPGTLAAIRGSGTVGGGVIVNNLIEGWSAVSGMGIQLAPTDMEIMVSGNWFFNCSTDIANPDHVLSPRASDSNVTLTASPFVDAANKDLAAVGDTIKEGNLPGKIGVF